ncbi:MAG: protein TolQ [Desulfobacterales bacterium SG8_35]|nr:MAG: protein TolQ [Desulfobacterales bacterium SG8_35]
MIIDAGPMVKFVMLLLLIFSLVSWTIIIMKHLSYKRALAETELFLDIFWKSKNLADAYKAAKEIPDSPEATIFILGFNELQKIGRSRVTKQGAEETLEMQLASMDNLKRALRKAENKQLTRLGMYLSFLATTGSATPFIGLFGTVWGIMTSFQDIGMRGSASLAVVAPGISEALVATAAGLAVAIPSVIFYNYYSNKLSVLENNMQGFSADFLNLVERDLLSRV